MAGPGWVQEGNSDFPLTAFCVFHRAALNPIRNRHLRVLRGDQKNALEDPFIFHFAGHRVRPSLSNLHRIFTKSLQFKGLRTMPRFCASGSTGQIERKFLSNRELRRHEGRDSSSGFPGIGFGLTSTERHTDSLQVFHFV